MLYRRTRGRIDPVDPTLEDEEKVQFWRFVAPGEISAVRRSERHGMQRRESQSTPPGRGYGDWV